MKPYFYTKELEDIANAILDINANAKGNNIKPDYTNRDFLNAVIIFHNALFDKMYDLMDAERMPLEDMEKMSVSCGLDLRKLIHTYTGLDTHKVEEFL